MQHSYLLSGVIVCASSLAGVAHGGWMWSYFAGGDAAFNAIASSGTLERAVTEGRIGNNATNGTWEQAIWDRGGVGTPEVTGQLAYTNGTVYNWSVEWDGSDSVRYTQGSQVLAWNGVAGNFTDIFIRVRSASDSSVALRSMEIDGLGIGDLASAGAVPAEYIRLTHTDGDAPAFVLSGTSQFSWTVQPNNSALAFQVKLTNVIPAPGAMALAGLAVLGCVRRRR